MLVFDLDGNERLPEEFYFSSKWDNGEPAAAKQEFLEVKIPVDTRKLAVLERKIQVNETLDFEGQKMTFAEVVQTPLRLNVHMIPNARNTREFEFAANYRLYTKNPSGEAELQIEDTDVNPAEWIVGYYSPGYVQGDTLELRGEGIQTIVKENMKMVIDTTRQKMKGESDSRLKLLRIEKEDFSMLLSLTLQPDQKSAEEHMVQHLGVAAVFTDGQGNKHSLSYPGKWINEIRSDQSKSGLDEFVLGIDNTAYPQPLTFDVTRYMVHDIKKPFEIKIEKQIEK